VAFADIDRRLVRNLAGLGLVTILALAAALSGGRFILRQIDALVAATGKLASGEITARASVLGGGSELGLLASAFNSMAATLQLRDRDLRIAQDKTRKAEVELAVTHAQMAIATQIQRSLLPDDPLALDCVRFAGRCIPADAVGGDYFGYFPRGVSGVDSLVGDVSGHGVGPALLMAETRSMFLAERLVATSAAQILAKLNSLLYDDLDRAGQFISASCAIFDVATRELSYANAGHPPALLLRAGTMGCTTLTAEGALLGISRHVDFTEVKVTLQAGDIVVFYTDGITEAQNGAGEMFGVDRLGEAVAALRADDPEILVAGVLESLESFAGGTRYEDDLTVVAMKLTR